jgi:hypothetical protein
MFMRVNSKCAHQVRPPLGPLWPCSAAGETLRLRILPSAVTYSVTHVCYSYAAHAQSVST